MSQDILIVDDEAGIRDLIEGILSDEGFSTMSCANSDDAYALIAEKSPALVILDIWLQGSAHDGLEILKTIAKNHPHIPVLMISGHGTIETAVAAIKDGAYDFIEKPFKSDRLILMIRRALETAALKQENAALRKQTQALKTPDLSGHSAPIEKLRQLLARAAPTNSRMLLTGEPGTGKNVVAHKIHMLSRRAENPYMVVNCAMLQPERLELELFGSLEQGQARSGLLEQAHGGTLLLDEVADMTLATQAKIMRVLQEQRFQKLGSSDFIEVDVRILATTNRNLEKMIRQGDFREDFYYRLNVVPVHIPPLRERSADVECLASEFLENISGGLGLEDVSFERSALDKLTRYKWPGNVRQLRNIIESVLIMHGNNERQPYTVEQLPPEITGLASSSDAISPIDEAYLDLTLRDAREAFEREYLLSQIERFEGNISKTAQFVGMERSALHRKMKSLRLNENHEDDEKETAETLRKRA